MKISKVSQACIDLIRTSESFRDKPYLCPAGVPTIGYGSTTYLNGQRVTLKDPAITKEMATRLLMKKLEYYERVVDSFTRDDINQHQFDALLDFAYNAGEGNLKSSTLLKKVNANPNDASIRSEFMKWTFGGDGSSNGKDDDGDGKVDEAGEKQWLNGLAIRRQKDADLYFKPVAA